LALPIVALGRAMITNRHPKLCFCVREAEEDASLQSVADKGGV